MRSLKPSWAWCSQLTLAQNPGFLPFTLSFERPRFSGKFLCVSTFEISWLTAGSCLPKSGITFLSRTRFLVDLIALVGSGRSFSPIHEHIYGKDWRESFPPLMQRSFICPSHVVASGLIKNIGSFVNLQVLKISFTLEGLSTQDSVVRRLLDSFSRSGTNIQKLTLTEIPRIDSKLLDSLSLTFPQLKSLEMESSKRIDFDCCTVCLEDSLGYMRHSPIPDYYANAEKLAVDISSLHSFWLSLNPVTCSTISGFLCPFFGVLDQIEKSLYWAFALRCLYPGRTYHSFRRN